MEKLSSFEIPLDKELTANCLVVTRTKLGELILVAMVICGMSRVCALEAAKSLNCCLMVYGMMWGP